MKTILRVLKQRKNRLISRYSKKQPQSIVLKNKPLSVLTLREALIANKLIDNDGFKPEDIIDINNEAIWENFCEIFKKNEKNNVRFGRFIFYIEENHVMSQLHDVNPTYFQMIINHFCQKLGCIAEFQKETREEIPGLTLHKVIVKHEYLSKDPSEFLKSIRY